VGNQIKKNAISGEKRSRPERKTRAQRKNGDSTPETTILKVTKKRSILSGGEGARRKVEAGFRAGVVTSAEEKSVTETI